MRNEDADELTPELAEVAAALARLEPRAVEVDRVAVAYQAGLAAGRAERPVVVCHTGKRVWQAATGFATATALLLSVRLIQSEPPRPPSAREPSPPIAATNSAPTPESSPALADAGPATELQPVSRRMPRRTKAELLAALEHEGYFALRELALDYGLDALPRPAMFDNGEPTEPVDQKELLEELLRGV